MNVFLGLGLPWTAAAVSLDSDSVCAGCHWNCGNRDEFPPVTSELDHVIPGMVQGSAGEDSLGFDG